MKRGVKLVTDGTDNHLVLLDRRDPVRPGLLPGRVRVAGLGGRHEPQLDPAGSEWRVVHLRRPDRDARADLTAWAPPSSTAWPS